MQDVVLHLCTRTVRGAAALLFAAFVAACGAEPEAGADEGATTRAEAAAAGETPGARAAQERRPVDVAGLGHDSGDPGAPIRVVEFSDFGCGYCRRFHVETYPTLHEEYVETGLVRWKYVPFVLGRFPHGEVAATAGECAIEQGRFAPLRDRLFHDQRAWSRTNEPREVLIRLAAEEGLDGARFRTCIEENRPEERVRENVRAGRTLGVRGTPTFFIDGHPLQGAQPARVFRQIFDRLLDARREGAGTAGGGS